MNTTIHMQIHIQTISNGDWISESLLPSGFSRPMRNVFRGVNQVEDGLQSQHGLYTGGFPVVIQQGNNFIVYILCVN